ncbi:MULTISPECIES: hypothetical protein [Halorussus]|uniref:hypothetical protein n=1 Tax=Halorussus TaxID=1070314 RepID=UPI000E21623F|nr:MULTISPECIES: hypothetical protein [Halorussus]NHN58552.1 hypothetical protein [Halorussus sp. JP-T4]
MTVDESTDPPTLNEETPPLDAVVAVEWWHRFKDDGEPELDTHHGFHDAEHVVDGTPPAVQDGEFVTASGGRVTADSQPEDMRESRYLYITHREALTRDITPCVECFPRYATERRLDKAGEEDGILTEAGVEGAVFPVWIRPDKESGWDLDSVHDSYTSLLYRTYAIREHAGSVGERLRYSLRPIRRCEYTSFEEAATVEPSIAHVSTLRTIQPEELPEVRDRLGDEPLLTPVEHEHRFTDTGEKRAPLVHRAETSPCGYERETRLGLLDDVDNDLQEELDVERQTVADVIERGNVVEFCESCFPEFAGWDAESDN